jgi:hypothetical protein
MAKKPTGPRDVAELRARIASARVASAPKPALDQARRALIAWLDTAERHGMTLNDVLRGLASGQAAASIGAALHDTISADPPEVLRNAACRSGCAFCCILSGGDGGTITRTEAEQVHRALAPLAGEPDGRRWHPAACPALDPNRKICRIYDARPTICRSFVSSDAAVCEENAEGGAALGAGVLGSHLTYLAAHAVARAALGGTARVRTYALDRIAHGAVSGADLAEALAAAEQKPRVLDDALKGTARIIGGGTRR